MGNTNTPYIAKNAQPLANPTAATLFSQLTSPIATVAATQVPKVAYAVMKGYDQYGAGTSNNINVVQFSVRAAGRVAYGVAGNFTPAIVVGAVGATGNFLPGASVSAIITASPQAASGVGTGIWQLSATLSWDPNTGIIAGLGSGYEAVLVSGTATETLTAVGAITPLTGYTVVPPTLSQSVTTPVPIINPTGEGVLYFAVTGLFSVSNANNVAYQDMLEVEDQ